MSWFGGGSSSSTDPSKPSSSDAASTDAASKPPAGQSSLFGKRSVSPETIRERDEVLERVAQKTSSEAVRNLARGQPDPDAGRNRSEPLPSSISPIKEPYGATVATYALTSFLPVAAISTLVAPLQRGILHHQMNFAGTVPQFQGAFKSVWTLAKRDGFLNLWRGAGTNLARATAVGGLASALTPVYSALFGTSKVKPVVGAEQVLPARESTGAVFASSYLTAAIACHPIGRVRSPRLWLPLLTPIAMTSPTRANRSTSHPLVSLLCSSVGRPPIRVLLLLTVLLTTQARLLISMERGRQTRFSLGETLQNIVRNEGYRGLFRGVIPVIPHHAAIAYASLTRPRLPGSPGCG